ncbi:MAG: M48 family metallopeptidase [Clostridia bacterium]|nr:M48 family metallopeptidase [Clostridia bacterium]
MTFKVILIICVLIKSIYSILLNAVRYRSASNPTPANLADVYDAETYQKWKKYSAEHNRLSMISEVISCIAMLALLITNAYSAFASIFPEGGGMYAVVILTVAVDTIIEIPIKYVSTMVIEQKYGFNRSSVKTFVIDCIRSLLLEFVLTLALCGLMALLHGWVGDWIMLLFALVVFAITMLISFLYPIFSRLGNKFTPLEDGELKDKLLALLEKYGYKVKAIEVMDASRRTTKLNAYFTGFGKMKTIVLYDNLLNVMTEDEICAIFAHEMGHGLHKDVLKGQILNIGNLLLMGVLVWLTLREPTFYTSFGFSEINYGFAYIIIGVWLGLSQPLTSLLTNARSRAAEFRADRQSVEEGYGEAMIVALKKLAKDNFAHLSPSKINVALEYSHPPLSRRVEEVEKALRSTK